MARPYCLKAPYAVAPGHGEIELVLKWTLPSSRLVLGVAGCCLGCGVGGEMPPSALLSGDL